MKSVSRDRTNPDAYFNLGRLGSSRNANRHMLTPCSGCSFQAVGQLEDAVTAFFSALMLRPDMFEGWLNLGASLTSTRGCNQRINELLLAQEASSMSCTS